MNFVYLDVVSDSAEIKRHDPPVFMSSSSKVLLDREGRKTPKNVECH